MLLPAQRVAMERVYRQPQLGWIRADFVARQQPAIAIKGGVFSRLGRQWRRQLLEARQRAPVQLLVVGNARVLALGLRQPSGDGVQRALVQLSQVPANARRRGADQVS